MNLLYHVTDQFCIRSCTFNCDCLMVRIAGTKAFITCDYDSYTSLNIWRNLDTSSLKRTRPSSHVVATQIRRIKIEGGELCIYWDTNIWDSKIKGTNTNTESDLTRTPLSRIQWKWWRKWWWTLRAGDLKLWQDSRNTWREHYSFGLIFLLSSLLPSHQLPSQYPRGPILKHPTSFIPFKEEIMCSEWYIVCMLLIKCMNWVPAWIGGVDPLHQLYGEILVLCHAERNVVSGCNVQLGKQCQVKDIVGDIVGEHLTHKTELKWTSFKYQ